MAWIWMRVRMSVRLGWQDTAQTLGRLIFGLLVAVVATALAIVVFRQPGALLTIFAYPIVVGLTYLFFVARRLAGWNRLWRRESRVVPIPEGRQVQFSLRYKAPIALLQGVTMEISCDLRDPGGWEIRGEDVSGHRGQLYKTYHDLYDRTSSLVPGTYWVLWKDRKVPGSGKWRVFDAHRITLPPLPPADAAGPRLPQSVIR